jgi:hypothetical protein
MQHLDAAGADSARRRHRDRDAALHRPVIEVLLEADDDRARRGAALQRVLGALERRIDERRREHLVAAAVEPAEEPHRAMLSATCRGRVEGNTCG